MNRVQEQCRQHPGGHVGTGDGDPEDQGQHRHHEGKSQQATGHQAVDCPIQVETGSLTDAVDGTIGQTRSLRVDQLHQLLVEVLSHLPTQASRESEDVLGIGALGIRKRGGP